MITTAKKPGTAKTLPRVLPTALAGCLLLALLPSPSGAAIPADVQRALVAQRELVEQRPHRPGLWNDLANLLVLAGLPEEAEEAYRRSLELEPDAVSARYNLALLQQETGQTNKSKRTLKQVLKTSPDHAWSHYHLGVAYADTGNRNSAVKHYANAVRLEPRLTDPAFNPHILDNDLAPQAVLKAYSDLPAAELAPRIYANRARVVQAMIGTEASTEETQKTAAQMRRDARREKRESKKQRADADDG
ncbi:MAG: tetratricopeptide repeat protein [Acidobacteriota bacterium]|nr:tetratricopeptide repeat protein [Acidobacteriota bacterium]